VPAAYWYYGLVAISLGLLCLALRHRGDWKLLVLHLSVFSIIHPLEIIIMTTNGYRYLPGVLAFPAYADDFLGAYVSDLFIVPASVIIICAFSLSWPAILGIAAVFTGVDWLFTVLGIYRHVWWKSVYTGIGLLILYAISRRLWANLQARRPSLAFRLLMIHLTFFALQSASFFAVNRGGVLFTMQFPFLHPGSTPVILAYIVSGYQLIISITVAIFTGLKMPRLYRTLGIGIVIAMTWAIGHYGIFVPQVAITPYHLLLLSAASLALLTVLFRMAGLDYLFPQ